MGSDTVLFLVGSVAICLVFWHTANYEIVNATKSAKISIEIVGFICAVLFLCATIGGIKL